MQTDPLNTHHKYGLCRIQGIDHHTEEVHEEWANVIITLVRVNQFFFLLLVLLVLLVGTFSPHLGNTSNYTRLKSK